MDMKSVCRINVACLFYSVRRVFRHTQNALRVFMCSSGSGGGGGGDDVWHIVLIHLPFSKFICSKCIHMWYLICWNATHFLTNNVSDEWWLYIHGNASMKFKMQTHTFSHIHRVRVDEEKEVKYDVCVFMHFTVFNVETGKHIFVLLFLF